MTLDNIPFEARSLGQPLAVFKTNYLRLIIQILVFSFLSGFIIVQFELIAASDLLSEENIFLTLFTLFLLGLALRDIAKLLLHINHRVYVFPSGFAYTNLGGTNILLWRDIDKIWEIQYKYSFNFVPVIIIEKLKVQDLNGQVHRLSRVLRKFSDLSGMIVEQVIENKYPKALAALENGVTLEFAPFQVTNKNITYKNKTALWEELAELYFWEGGIIYFKKAGSKTIHRILGSRNWIKVHVLNAWKIPNFKLMLALVDYYIERSK